MAGGAPNAAAVAADPDCLPIAAGGAGAAGVSAACNLALDSGPGARVSHAHTRAFKRLKVSNTPPSSWVLHRGFLRHVAERHRRVELSRVRSPIGSNKRRKRVKSYMVHETQNKKSGTGEALCI